MTRLQALVAVALFGSTSFACHPRVRVEGARGPDGDDAWRRVSCRHMDRACYTAVERMCPNGYYFTPAGEARASRQVATSADGKVVVVEGAAAAPESGKNVKTLPPQRDWDRDMYTSDRGAILVKCAARRDEASAR